METNKYVHVVEDLTTLRELGFVENGFKNWEAVLRDTAISKVVISVSGDYVFLSSEDPSRRDRIPFDKDIVTLWNKDVAGVISKEKLETLIQIIEEGNVRQKV